MLYDKLVNIYEKNIIRFLKATIKNGDLKIIIEILENLHYVQPDGLKLPK